MSLDFAMLEGLVEQSKQEGINERITSLKSLHTDVGRFCKILRDLCESGKYPAGLDTRLSGLPLAFDKALRDLAHKFGITAPYQMFEGVINGTGKRGDLLPEKDLAHNRTRDVIRRMERQADPAKLFRKYPEVLRDFGINVIQPKPVEPPPPPVEAQPAKPVVETHVDPEPPKKADKKKKTKK